MGGWRFPSPPPPLSVLLVSMGSPGARWRPWARAPAMCRMILWKRPVPSHHQYHPCQRARAEAAHSPGTSPPEALPVRRGSLPPAAAQRGLCAATERQGPLPPRPRPAGLLPRSRRPESCPRQPLGPRTSAAAPPGPGGRERRAPCGPSLSWNVHVPLSSRVETEGAYRALCARCAKSWLFSTTGSSVSSED